MNDAEPYIAAVADACHAAGLIVADYTSDNVDPRDGVITIVLRSDADPDEDYRDVRVLGWDEEKGWLDRPAEGPIWRADRDPLHGHQRPARPGGHRRAGPAGDRR